MKKIFPIILTSELLFDFSASARNFTSETVSFSNSLSNVKELIEREEVQNFSGGRRLNFPENIQVKVLSEEAGGNVYNIDLANSTSQVEGTKASLFLYPKDGILIPLIIEYKGDETSVERIIMYNLIV